ncbi:MAG: hypothetical protein H0V17_10060 [Deltaproteobacteria bacterium]|nr:hypothetical protein [Deltaproteobacteria bacterium]
MTRYEFFRKRIAPLLFLGMVGLIAYDACRQEERHHTTIVLDLGDAAADVREVNAEVFSGGESVAVFHRAALPGSSIGPCRFETALPEDTAELRLDVRLPTRSIVLTKTIRPIEGSVTTIPLGDQLR